MATSFRGPPRLPVAPSASNSCLVVLPQPLLFYCCFLAAGKVRWVERAVGIQNKFKVFLFIGEAGSGSPNTSVPPTRTPRPRVLQPIGVMGGAAARWARCCWRNQLAVVCELKELLLPQFGSWRACGTWSSMCVLSLGGQRLERCSPSCIKPQGGDILFLPKSCGLIWISAASSCFSVT